MKRRASAAQKEPIRPRSESLMSQAIEVATLAHDGITDRKGRPYILHALEVAMDANTSEEFVVGMLHDVLEHSNDRVTVKDLVGMDFPQQVIEAVVRLTKRKEGLLEERWEDYISRVAEHPLTLRVKLRDIESNMEMLRSRIIEAADAERMERYLSARERLLLLMED